MGLFTEVATDISTLKKCTDLRVFISNENNRSSNYYDLSGCTNLEFVFMRYPTCTAYITLPDTSSRLDEDGRMLGYSVTIVRNYFTQIKGGAAIESLSIDGAYNVSNANYWKIFDGLKNSSILREVSLDLRRPDVSWGSSSRNVSSSGLSTFGSCPNLERFSWVGDGPEPILSSFTDISALTSCLNLEEVSISGTCVATFPNFENCTKLKKVEIINSILTDISNISKLVGLEEVSFQNETINSFPNLSLSSRLSKVTVSNCNLVDISNIQKNTSITYLDLSNNSIGNLTGLDKLTSLTYLDLSINSIKGSTPVDNISILNSFRNQILAKDINVSSNKLDSAEKALISWITSK